MSNVAYAVQALFWSRAYCLCGSKTGRPSTKDRSGCHNQKNVCVFLEQQGSLTVIGQADILGLQDPLTVNGYADVQGYESSVYPNTIAVFSSDQFPVLQFSTFWSKYITVNTWQVKDRVFGYEVGSGDHHDGDSDSETRR